MIYRAKADEKFYIGLNRDRINKGLHIRQQTKELGTNAGSVIVETDDVRSAKIETDVEEIQSTSRLKPPLNIGLPNAFHPTVINTTFLVNTLTDAGLYFPQFNNIGYRTTFPEFYYTIHGTGNFTPPVYVTNWGDDYE
tara:strand:- start:301 stop:714 length:414 start_codon:yes stop_codon:yes gene_type:complete